MNDKNEEKVVTNQSKNNKRRRFRPKNKPKQEGETTEQTSLASKSVIDNFFAAEQAEAHAEPKSQNPHPKKLRNNKNQNKNWRKIISQKSKKQQKEKPKQEAKS